MDQQSLYTQFRGVVGSVIASGTAITIRDGQLFNYRDNRDYFIGNKSTSCTFHRLVIIEIGNYRAIIVVIREIYVNF